MSLGLLCASMKKNQTESVQIADDKFPYATMWGGLSVKLNHLKPGVFSLPANGYEANKNKLKCPHLNYDEATNFGTKAEKGRPYHLGTRFSGLRILMCLDIKCDSQSFKSAGVNTIILFWGNRAYQRVDTAANK